MERSKSKIKSESPSPAQQVWKRFVKNKLAVFGLLVIALAVFISIFCYILMPDRTPDANSMSLPITTQSPGFKTTLLLLRKSTMPEATNPFRKLFFGNKSPYEQVAISSYRYEGSDIIYKEFSSTPENQTEEIRIPRSEVEGITTKTFLLGTDRYGRDLLSRLMAGTRVSLAVGFIAVLISLLIGVTLGSLAGFYRGKTDSIIVWLINVVWSIPTLLLVISITLVLGKGFGQVFIAVGLTMWVEVARVARGQIFSLREQEFITAGRALGFNNLRIIIRHVLPNIMGPVIVVAASNFAGAILIESGLSFLGIGAQPPTPTWGSMIKENYGYIIIPHLAYLAILPGIAIMLMVMAFTFVGNGLRDAIDSKQQIRLIG